MNTALKIIFFLFLFFLTDHPFCHAQQPSLPEEQRTVIRGKVIDPAGEGIVGAGIVEESTGHGVISGSDGSFSLEVQPDAWLNISFIGYASQRVSVKGKEMLIICLQEQNVELEPVIVTALGIPRKEASLSYDAIQISSEELLRVKDPNMILSLAGKAAGVLVNKNASGLGGSSRVLIRGMRSVAGNNQPLYVIDGMPMLNASNEQAATAIGGTADAGNRDGGDGISNLNPEDIESVSILKGAPAAALYGSDAANGVILITTKKGRKGVQKITFSTHLTIDRAFCLPQFQDRYGVSNGVESWGKRVDVPAYDNVGDFFETGVTSITSLSLTFGNDQMQHYFSYANTTGKGIMDKNKLSRHNLNLRASSSLFNGLLKLDGNINLVSQVNENKPPSGGFYMNSLVGLYRFPRGMDLSTYRDQFEVWDESRHLYVQNWHADTQDFEQNPYWVVNRIQSKDRRMRVMASLSADMTVTEWLKIQARGNVDGTTDKFRQKFYASTAPALAGQNGRYIDLSYDETLVYGDVMALVRKKWNDFSLQATLGASINHKRVNSLRYDSKTASLKYANIFTIANVIMNGSAYIQEQIEAQKQMQSVFATAQVGYKESLFVDVSARNDWSSTLAYTPHEGCGFFYPSVGVAWIMNKSVRMPAWISFAKVRATYSRVGNDIPWFITNPLSHLGAGGEMQLVDAAPFEDMKPEMTASVEVGTEWKFLHHRLGFNATFYQTNTRNQFFQLPAKSGDNYAYRYVNAGNIRNRGVELSLEGIPVDRFDFRWKSQVNLAHNKNTVLRLHEELPVFIYGPRGFSSSYAMKLKEGGSFGDIYGKAFKRDAQGRIVYETTGENKGMPAVEGDGNLIRVGNANPVLTLGWNNMVSYKNIVFSFLVDCRLGGKVLSQTQADMDLFGVTQATADARDAGYVELEGTRINDVETFYKKVVGGRAGVTEYYMYDATNIRLRELSVGYDLPSKILQRIRIFDKLQFSIMMRNLFFIYKKAPFDPDLILSTGNDNQGIEVYGMPTTRSLGLNIKCEF